MERNRKVQHLAARLQLFPQILQLQIRRYIQEALDIVQERRHVVPRVEHDLVRTQTGHDLVQSVLAVPFLNLPHRIVELVLVEVHNLPALGQVGPQTDKLGQVED